MSGISGRPLVPPRVPSLTILYHADARRVGERAALTGLAAGRPQRLARGEPAFSHPVPGEAGPRPLGDPHLSRSPILFTPGDLAGAVRLGCAETRTAVLADGEPVLGERELTSGEVERGVVLLLANRVVLLLHLLDAMGAPAGLPSCGMVGESAAIVEVRREVLRVAGLDVPVLLRGETGTGKELIARALHAASPRAGRPFLVLNMGAVPPTLAAAELFGAARGAFTGAEHKRAGWFRRADGGTLFLDEIGETPPEVQPLLLRALESGEIQPVGGDGTLRVDVRVIAATDVALEAAVAADRFRAPLLHRLSGYEIRVPPLALRRDDFGRLFLHFLRQELAGLGAEHLLDRPGAAGRPWLPAELVARLATRSWPGNVRELRNVARRLAVSCRDADEAALPPALLRSPGDPEDSSVAVALPPERPPRKVYRRPEEVSEEELLAGLRAHRWRLQPAAAALGISRTSLYDRIDASSTLRKAGDLSRQEIERQLVSCGGDLDRMVEVLEVSKRGLQRRIKQLGL